MIGRQETSELREELDPLVSLKATLDEAELPFVRHVRHAYPCPSMFTFHHPVQCDYVHLSDGRTIG